MTSINMSLPMGAPFKGIDDPCILGYTNGTYPNGTLGKGTWSQFGVYEPAMAEMMACQANNDPWANSMYYGQWTTYFILAVIISVSVLNGIKRLHNLNRITGAASIAQFHPKISAFFRMASYRQLRFSGGSIPPLGPSFILFGFLLFSTLVCFLRQPFYRPPNYGSSPLGLRSEWIATAMVPWIYAAATKRNFLEFSSGVSFQRIMTFHKWAPWICLYMSVVHTWAMIIRANRQEPWWYTIKNNEAYWNGFPALIALAWLCVMSLGPIRKRFYETFYIFHMIAAAVFLIWMYIHLADELKSWQYMHAATVLWGAGLLWRTLVYAFDHGWFRRIPRASLETLSSNAILVRIAMPTNRTWSAGSCVYLRFLSIKPWESHPFTISSLPISTDLTAASKNQESPLKTHEMVFVIRPYDGLTARLQKLASSGSLNMRACLVDGPYGGFMDSLRACDCVVLIAGGSGMSAIAPVAQALSRSLGALGMTCCQTYRVIWAMREATAMEWFKDQLCDIKGIEIFVSGTDPNKILKSEDKGKEIEDVQPANPASTEFKFGRPNINLLLRNAAEQNCGRIGVMVCGPASMLLDTRNTVARIESSIFLSDKGIRCSEIELYEESFEM